MWDSWPRCLVGPTLWELPCLHAVCEVFLLTETTPSFDHDRRHQDLRPIRTTASSEPRPTLICTGSSMPNCHTRITCVPDTILDPTLVISAHSRVHNFPHRENSYITYIAQSEQFRFHQASTGLDISFVAQSTALIFPERPCFALSALKI